MVYKETRRYQLIGSAFIYFNAPRSQWSGHWYNICAQCNISYKQFVISIVFIMCCHIVYCQFYSHFKWFWNYSTGQTWSWLLNPGNLIVIYLKLWSRFLAVMLEAKLDAKIPLLSYKWVVEDVNMCTRQFPKMLTKFSNLVMLIVELPCVRLVIQWYFM